MRRGSARGPRRRRRPVRTCRPAREPHGVAGSTRGTCGGAGGGAGRDGRPPGGRRTPPPQKGRGRVESGTVCGAEDPKGTC